MRRVIIITIVALFCSPLWALSYIGPPTSNVKEGDFILGFDYSDNETDIEWSGYGERDTVKDVEGNLYLGKIGLGISDGFEFFGRFGSSEFEFEDDTLNICTGGNEFAWGLGTKATLGQKDNISWGALFQYMSLYAEDNYEIFDVDVHEFQFAVGPTYHINELSIYGGPFLHFIEGDASTDYFGPTRSVDIEQESVFGGYAGICWQISEVSSLNVEYQLTGDAQAIGICFFNRFGGQSKSKKSVVWQKPKIHTDSYGRAIDGTAYTVKRDKDYYVVSPIED